VPGSLLWILIIFAIRTYRTSGTGSVTTLLVAVGIGLAVVLVVAFLVPDRRIEEPVIELASDYPVPPLDLTVPTPSRHKLRPRPIVAGPEHEEPVRSG